MTACLPALGKAPRVVEAAAPKQVANGTAATATAAAGGGASTVEDALPGSFCAELWQSVSGSPGSVFSSVMSHPFLTELMEGTLDEATFKGYLVQGCLYLREYGRALAVLASKAPRPAWGAFLARCVQEAWQEEALFHQNLLMSHYGTTLEHEIAAATLSPSSLLYSSFVLSTVHERCFAEGSPHPLYQRFIDRFGGTDYELLTLEAAAMANEAAAELGDVQRQRAAAIFAKGCRLEYMFFDGAYRQEQWPLALPGKRCAGSVQRRRLAPLAALEDPLAAVPAARPEGVAWDPDGLLPPPTSESHFERRARLKAEAAAAAGGAAAPQAPSNSLRPIPAEQLAAGGLPAADGSLYDRPAFEKHMAERFLPVDLDAPGLRIMHFDPPVFTLPGFFSEEQCDDAVAAAVEGNTLVPSKVGGGNLREEASSAYNARRTSSSVLLDATVQAAHPRLRAMASALQSKGLQLLGQGTGAGWGSPGKLPAPGQYCYESLQMARYEQGQHFLAHEDGFPASLARQNGFQRQATLLVYLNTTQAGGATRFDLLNLAVRPAKGQALLFFPAFSDGTSDPRSLHTAENAADSKWVTQQWVARGLAGAPVDPIQAALTGRLQLDGSGGAGSSSGGTSAAPAAQQRRVPGVKDEGPSAAELAMAAGKRGKGKKGGGGKKAGKGFGA